MAGGKPTNSGPRLQDLTGKRFGRLLVIRYGESVKEKSGTHVLWLCLCDCGAEKMVRGKSLRTGHTASCGCLWKEMSNAGKLGETHGMGSDKDGCIEYRAWRGMIQRCTNAKNPSFRNYGARGIRVCQGWRESFLAFLEDVGPRPSIRHTLDRFPDQNGNYEPGNCRWATRKQQARNMRVNRLVTFNGETKVLAEWAEIIGVTPHCLLHRLQRWTLERAMTTPPKSVVNRL